MCGKRAWRERDEESEERESRERAREQGRCMGWVYEEQEVEQASKRMREENEWRQQ